MKWILLLSGGAARGAFQVPVIERLIAEKGMPAAVFGTSVGAVHAAAVGSGVLPTLRDIWVNLGGVGDFQQLNFDAWNGLFTLNPLRKMLEARLGPSWRIPTGVGMVDLAEAKHHTALLNEMSKQDVIDAVVASSSQPGIHERAKFRGKWYADGGVMHVVPTYKLNKAGIDPKTVSEIHAVCCFPLDPTPAVATQGEVSTLFEQSLRALDILTTSNSKRDIQRLRGIKGPRVFAYCPPSWEAIGPSFDAGPDMIQRRLELGEEVARSPVKL
jgi:predicted acylesterase/phospholipase RssA